MSDLTNLENKIWNTKNQIYETREYISSDYCIQCGIMYERLSILEEHLKVLENECNRLSERS